MGSHHRAQPHEKVWARPMITKAEDSGVCGALCGRSGTRRATLAGRTVTSGTVSRARLMFLMFLLECNGEMR